MRRIFNFILQVSAQFTLIPQWANSPFLAPLFSLAIGVCMIGLCEVIWRWCDEDESPEHQSSYARRKP